MQRSVKAGRIKATRATGDNSGSRLHPEKLSRGKNHWTYLHPERRLFGKRNWAYKKPKAAIHLRKWHQDNPDANKGERNGNAKISFKIANKIRKLKKKTKMSNIAIGKKFKVTDVLIGLIIRNKLWKK